MNHNRFPKVLTLMALALAPFAFAETEEVESAEVVVATAPVADSAEAKSEKIRDLLLPQEKELDDNAFQAALKEAKALGATEQQLLEGEIFRSVIQDKGGDLAALGNRLEKFAPNWDAETAFGIRDKALASGLVHIIYAKDALAKNDEKKFRAEGTRAIWIEPQLSGFVLGMYAQDLLKKSAKSDEIVALDKAIASNDDAAVLKAFEAALWKNPFLSEESVIAKVADYRAAKKVAPPTLPLNVKSDEK